MQQYLSWEILWGLGLILLFAGLVYGYLRTARRTPKERAATEEATRELYKRPERYRRRTREDINRALEEERREDPRA